MLATTDEAIRAKRRDVRIWHETDIDPVTIDVCYRRLSGRRGCARRGPKMTHSGSQASHFAVTHSNSSANDVVGYVLQRGLGAHESQGKGIHLV